MGSVITTDGAFGDDRGIEMVALSSSLIGLDSDDCSCPKVIRSLGVFKGRDGPIADRDPSTSSVVGIASVFKGILTASESLSSPANLACLVAYPLVWGSCRMDQKICTSISKFVAYPRARDTFSYTTVAFFLSVTKATL